MTKNNNETYDERYSVVDKAIKDAFLLLAKEKDIEKISVSDIIKKTGIVRSTFYNHYENVSDLITALEEETINDTLKFIKSQKLDKDKDICEAYFLTICCYTKKNPFFSRLIQCKRGDVYMNKAINILHDFVFLLSEDKKNKNNNKQYSFIVAGAIGFTLGILHKWISDGFDASEEYVANLLSSIFLESILPYMN